MKLTIQMAPIERCEATGCAYNVNQSCHARAITVGGGTHPACDTYVPSGRHVAVHSEPAGVGACKVEDCRYNHDLECDAPSIAVGRHGQHADCTTYEKRASAG